MIEMKKLSAVKGFYKKATASDASRAVAFLANPRLFQHRRYMLGRDRPMRGSPVLLFIIDVDDLR